jgi:hypothetical protein
MTSRLCCLAAVLVGTAGAACGGDPDTPTSPSASVTETFQATLDVGGVTTHAFPSNDGTLTITVRTVSAPGAGFGLGLGTWNARSGTCTLALSSGSAKQGDAFQAAASVAGAYCVQVGDAGGLTAPLGYTLTVAHP